MRNALAAFLVALIAGLVALAFVWGGWRPQQSLGVAVVGSVATLVPHGPELCTSPIGLGEPTDAVTFNPSTPPPHTPALEILIRNARTGVVVSFGHVQAGWDPHIPVLARLSPTVPPKHDIAFCIRDIGSRAVRIFGVPAGTAICADCFGHTISTTSTLQVSVGGRPVPGEISAVFTTAPTSLGTLIANTFAHASLFRPGFVGRGFWWVLLAALLLGVPALLVWSMRALRDERPDAPRSDK